MKIIIDLEKNELESLAEVLKRIGFNDIRKLSKDDSECYQAQGGFEKIRKELAYQGYAPR